MSKRSYYKDIVTLSGTHLIRRANGVYRATAFGLCVQIAMNKLLAAAREQYHLEIIDILPKDQLSDMERTKIISQIIQSDEIKLLLQPPIQTLLA